MVYRTAQLLFKCESTAKIAATLYAIEPLSIMYTSVLITETLFAALVVVWLYFIVRYLNRPLLRDLIASGVALAASVYVRPIGFFLPFVIAVGLFIRALMNDQQNKRLMLHVALFLSISMGLTTLWQIRNWTETGYFGFSGISSINMYFYLAASVLAIQQRVPWFEMQDRLGYRDDRIYFERHPEQTTWTPAQRLNYMSREGKRILRGSPLTYARIHLDGCIRTMFDPGATIYLKFFKLYPKQGGLLGKLVDDGILRTMSTLVVKKPLVFWSNAVFLLLEALYFSCACVALFSRRLVRGPGITAMILAVIYMFVISGGPAALCRFRHPAMPMICILAGYGLYLMLVETQGVSDCREIRSEEAVRITGPLFIVAAPS
jgi:hypothetical protein